jgi:RHS repeat-associated protein
MMRSATVGGVTTSYIYDGDNQRAYRSTADLSVQQFTIHDNGGRLLAELDGVTGQLDAEWRRDSIYLGARLLATRRPGGLPGIIEYAHTDRLGSVRATTDQSGNVLARHDYAAFGEDMGPGPATGPERQRFTGKQRDSETFFDYFGARYYRNVIGRFTSVDPEMNAAEALLLPQRWNRYAYVSNNPVRKVDPDGRYESDVHFDLTQALARAAGFSPEAAKQIASGDEGMDHGATAPIGEGTEIRRLYHFTTKERRDVMQKEFETSKNLDKLGAFLHAEQDSFAHDGYGPRLGHASALTAPDKTYNDIPKADRMAKDTFSILINASPNKAKAVTWELLSPFVHRFNAAKNEKDKMAILKEMADAVAKAVGG